MADKFPIQNLSPPIVSGPIYACAEAVHVSGFVPHATVSVYSMLQGIEEKLAEVVPPFAFADIALSRPAKLGESIYAIQRVGVSSSPHSIQPVIVTATPLSVVKASKPVVFPKLYQCGIVVPVNHLIPGVRLHVYENGIQLASKVVAGTGDAVLTPPLHSGGVVTAQEVMCEATHHGTKSLLSGPVVVQPAPSPVPPPEPDPNYMFVGNDTVTLSGLLIGARVEIFDNGIKISSGWAASGVRNYFPITSHLTVASKITATQKLCATSSVSLPVQPNGRLKAPVVLQPICPKSHFVVIRGTTINATVVILRGATIVGFAGAIPGDLVVGLGVALNPGDVITAVQFMGQNISPVSNAVTVVNSLSQPFVEILGGEPFFLPKAGEQPIDGPVFPRGRGNGPFIRVQACCSKDVKVQILDPSKKVITNIVLTEVFPGYFTGVWPWTSTNAGWPTPNHIPVGQYTVVVHTGCDQHDARVPFYVIFNPADVGGPPRFSFDDITVWFRTYNDRAYGLRYYLRQSDMRVFSIALKAVSGMTDSYDAAIAVAAAEQALFSYSLNYHTNDVLDLILNFKSAQCADDASCLTSLLRAVGIPSHNVTADAGYETNVASWRYDTWIEFLAPHQNVTEWRVLHPHEYPLMPPESRQTFGTTKLVAMKDRNDIIIMANENWILSQLDDNLADVSFTRNSCGVPNQIITKAPWVDELCEKGYWPIPHWACANVSSQSFHSEGFSIVGESELAFGGRITGRIKLINRLEERVFGTVVIDVVYSALESKTFAQQSVDTTSQHVTLEQGQSSTLDFHLRLPATLSPGHDLLIWAHVGCSTLATHALQIAPGVTCRIVEPAVPVGGLVTWALSGHYTISASVTNTSQVSTLQNIDVELKVPFALAILDKAQRRLNELKPHESSEIQWKIEAIAPLRSGCFSVSVATVNAGSAFVRRAFQVVGPPAIVEVLPATNTICEHL